MSGWSDLTSQGKAYFDKLGKLEKLEVAVGFQAGEAHGDDGATVAEVAAYNELGTSTSPPRPFMKQSFENNLTAIQEFCDKVSAGLAQGKGYDETLAKLGVYLNGVMQEEIVNGDFAPNAESTIAKKGSDKPLIDTGLMRQSVNYIVREKTSS